MIIADNTCGSICTYFSHSDGLRTLVRAFLGYDSLPVPDSGMRELPPSQFNLGDDDAYIHEQHLSPFVRMRLAAPVFADLLKAARVRFEDFAQGQVHEETVMIYRPTTAYDFESHLLEAFGSTHEDDYVTVDALSRGEVQEGRWLDFIKAHPATQGGLTPIGSIAGAILPKDTMLKEVEARDEDSRWFLTLEGWVLNLQMHSGRWALASQHGSSEVARMLLSGELHISSRGQLLSRDLTVDERISVPSRYLTTVFAHKCLGNVAPPAMYDPQGFEDHLERIGAKAALREETLAPRRLR